MRGADRAIAVCDSLRNHLPTLLALSANSPFLDGQDTGLHSIRTQIFTRSFPRCGIHDPFGDWETYAGFVDLLERIGSVVESTQLWWSIRPHHSFGTVEVRICDAQSEGEESLALGGLLVACVAQAALDYDEGRLERPARGRADRGEPVAGDPLRARRPDDRLRSRGGGRRRRGGRAPDLVDRADATGSSSIDVLPGIGPNGAQRAIARALRGEHGSRGLRGRGRDDDGDLRSRDLAAVGSEG